jgi:acetolactate synthase-1/3 small subunit
MKIINPITISITTENALGVMQKVAAMFTRRRLNIESLAVSDAERAGLSRFTIVLYCTHEQADKLVKQMRKIVEVQEALFFENDDQLIYKEISFVRVGFRSLEERLLIEKTADRCGGIIVSAQDKSLVIEISGHEEEIDSLLDSLAGHNITGLVRSGRIAIAAEANSDLRYDLFDKQAIHSRLKVDETTSPIIN